MIAFRLLASTTARCVVTLGLAAQAFAAPTISPELSGCKAAVLMEPFSGNFLSEVNSHQPLPPASMVKIMTSYVTLQKVKEGVVRWEDMITTSAFASRVGGSQVYLKEKEQFTLREMLNAVLVQSANDAAVAIAEHIGGTQEGFVELMNAQAQALGMTESTFTSAHGLPPGKGQQPDLVSAHDMAKLSAALLRDFPEALELTGKVEEPFRQGTFIMRNHNHLLNDYPNCDGIKTGFYNDAGFCVSATAKRNNVRLVAVVMGCKERKRREAEAARLLSLGFAQYKAIEITKAGAISKPVPVVNGALKAVIPVTLKPASVVVKVGDEKQVVPHMALCKSLTAPVKKGTPCGAIVYKVGDREVGRAPVYSPTDVPALGFTGKLLRKVGL